MTTTIERPAPAPEYKIKVHQDAEEHVVPVARSLDALPEGEDTDQGMFNESINKVRDSASTEATSKKTLNVGRKVMGITKLLEANIDSEPVKQDEVEHPDEGLFSGEKSNSPVFGSSEELPKAEDVEDDGEAPQKDFDEFVKEVEQNRPIKER